MYSFKHVLHCVTFLALILAIQYLVLLIRPFTTSLNYELNFDNINLTLILLIVFSVYNYMVVIFKSMMSGQMILGLVAYDCFNDQVKLEANLKQLPLISFRVVTRGDYPQLIRKNLKINQDACKEAGLKNYIVEIVTEKPLSLPSDPKVKEILVPKNYVTKNGTLFKGRNLQYCLENDVSILKDNDWIVHLDEDSMVTADAVRGIANFIHEGKHQIGQGTITYDPFNVTGYWSKLLTNYRVSMDYGVIRFANKFNKQNGGMMKGSFVAIKVKAEKDITFDGGINSSVAEFVYFSMKAAQNGYTANWIEGVTREVGTLTIKEVAVQYTRAFNGVKLLCHCTEFGSVRLRMLIICYGGLFFSTAYLPIIIFDFLYGCPLYPSVARHMIGFCVAVDIYSSIFPVSKLDHLSILGSVWMVLLGLTTGWFLFPCVWSCALVRGFIRKDVKFEVTKKEA